MAKAAAVGSTDVQPRVASIPKQTGLARANFLYEIWTGLYMLDPWEKAAFNGAIVAAVSVGTYCAWRSAAAYFSGELQ